MKKDLSAYFLNFVVLSIFLLTVVTEASAEPYVTIINNGSSQNRVDIAILGDGYTAAEMAQYHLDVQQFIQGVFAQEPYLEYQGFFNVHRVDVISNESGADHPEAMPPTFVDTRFDATYNCQGIQRLICVNTNTVNQVIAASLPADHFDIKLVLVNDPVYGGSGGSVAVASTHTSAVELILHEVGHSFGLLADEYTTGPPPPCVNNVEPPEVNATRETQRALIKWNLWIDQTTPIPTTSTTPGLPGLYEGARYCVNGLYRPTNNSKMNTLGPPFEQINSEQHVKRVYNFAGPIDASLPTGGIVAMTTSQIQAFSVTTPQPFSHNLDINWTVDGQPAGTGPTLQLLGSTLSVGQHTVQVHVADPTPFVRFDPSGALQETRDWTVNVQAALNKPIFDFDGDSKTDISIFRPSVGQWWYLRSSDLDNRAYNFGTSTDTLAPADFTGDGKTDITFWRPSSGEWFILRSEDSSFFSFPFGTSGDIPAPGDYDGDGKADPTVFRPSSSTWYIQRSSDNGTTIQGFGLPEDKPVVADYDGDSKDDIAIFRPSNSQWWQLRSTDGVIAYQFGTTGDKTVPGDYTGDGKADVAFWRPSSGEWFILRSEDSSFYSVPFGLSTDIPTPGDYDGDGMADTAVFRPSTNTWFYQGSTSGSNQVTFGLSGDIPVPNAFVRP